MALLAQLLHMAALLMVAALALGVVFDRVGDGLRRNVAVGGLCGAFSALAMAAPIALPQGYVVDTRGPYLLVAALLGGPVGALAALPLPLASRLTTGGPAVLIGVASIFACLAIGLAVRAAVTAVGRSIDRGAVVALAGAAPLSTLALAAPHLGAEAEAARRMALPLVVPLLVFMPLGTLLLGLTTLGERARSEAARAAAAALRFQRTTEHVSREALAQHLVQQWRLHQRYGTVSAYILLSIDDAAAVRRALGPREWERLQEEIAVIIRRNVRQTDVCAPIDFDRFAVLLPHATSAGALPVAQRIQANVAESLVGETAHPVTLSVGIADVSAASYPEEVEAAAEGALFLANARQARGAVGPVALPPEPTAGPALPPRPHLVPVPAPAPGTFFPALLDPAEVPEATGRAASA